MLDQIANYFNNNPLIAILLVILALVVIWSIYCKSCQSSEHLDPTISSDGLNNLPKCDPNTDQGFYKEYVGATKLINFKCTYNGKEYYLASVNMADCSNITPDDLKKAPDCTNTTLVLLDKEDVDAQLKLYLSDIANDEKICVYTKNLECSSKVSSEEAKTQCFNEQHPECKAQRFFNHDFIVTEIIQQMTPSGVLPRRKYIIRGTSKPLKNGSSIPTMINQHLFENNGINKLCSDSFAYGSDINKNNYSEIIVIEKPNTTQTSILGNGDSSTVNLAMVTHQFIEGTDPETKQPIIHKLYDVNNQLKTMLSFVASCDKAVCTLNGRDYTRVCLTNDQLSTSILNFTPVLAGSYSG